MVKKVRVYTSDRVGMPKALSAAGTMITMLDATLVNGFNTQTITNVSVAAGIATGTVQTGHGFRKDDVLRITGAGIAALNADQDVLSVEGNTITFSASGVLDGAVGGSITGKFAPLGWNKPYGTTTMACYVSQNPTSSKRYLHVDNTMVQKALVRGFESMTNYDVSSGVGMFPKDADVTPGQTTNLYWPITEAPSDTTGGRYWFIVGDDKTFYYFICPEITSTPSVPATTNRGNGGMFGDIKSDRDGDAFHCMIAGVPTTAATVSNWYDASYQGFPYTSNTPVLNFGANNGQPMWLCRGYNQQGAGVRCGWGPAAGMVSANMFPGFIGLFSTFLIPSPVRGGWKFFDCDVAEYVNNAGDIRGTMRGVLWPKGLNSSIPSGSIIAPFVDNPNSRAITFYMRNNSSYPAQVAIDITGTWD